MLTAHSHQTLAKSLRGLVTEHILQVLMGVTMISHNVHDPGPRNFNVVGLVGFALPRGGRLDGINFASSHADGDLNIEMGGMGELLD